MTSDVGKPTSAASTLAVPEGSANNAAGEPTMPLTTSLMVPSPPQAQIRSEPSSMARAARASPSPICDVACTSTRGIQRFSSSRASPTCPRAARAAGRKSDCRSGLRSDSSCGGCRGRKLNGTKSTYEVIRARIGLHCRSVTDWFRESAAGTGDYKPCPPDDRRGVCQQTSPSHPRIANDRETRQRSTEAATAARGVNLQVCRLAIPR